MAEKRMGLTCAPQEMNGLDFLWAIRPVTTRPSFGGNTNRHLRTSSRIFSHRSYDLEVMISTLSFQENLLETVGIVSWEVKGTPPMPQKIWPY